MIRFSANLSFLFKEVPFPERFGRAREAGFSGVEFMWPGVDQFDAIRRAVADTGLEVALFNFDAGDMAAGDRGLAGDPQRRGAFRENVPVALELAAEIGCTRLNALVGLRRHEFELEDQLEVARENIVWAAEQAGAQGASIMIEPINTYDNGEVLIATSAAGLEFIRSVGADNVKLQYDVYHMQRMEGNLTETIRAHLSRIGHVQVADSPTRSEPGTGEINYQFILYGLEHRDYGGWVGLEYNPSTPSTTDSFAWMHEFGYRSPGETVTNDA